MDLQIFVYLAFLISAYLNNLTDCRVLDDYIRHYQELDYNTDHLHNAHLRHKRSTDPHVHIHINAFNNPLHLKLQHDAHIFAPDFVLEFNNTVTKPDLSFIYKGEVLGKPKSRVHGAIIQGIFRGQIIIPSEEETYHVEKSNRFFNNQPVFHSVIYKESDMVLDPYRENRTRERREAKEQGSCGYDNALKFMRETVNSEVIPENRAKRHENTWQEIHAAGDQSAKYTAEANAKLHDRKKRATAYGNMVDVNNEMNSCFLSLMSDVFFWNHYYNKANQNAELAKDEILAFFASHVAAIVAIYEGTRFQTYDNDMYYYGVTFAVQKTKVMTPDDCNDVKYERFCRDNVDVSNFLNMNSLLNHDLFCLAYVFTYRDFSQGTLGLAWVGSPSTASGGVCERNKKFTEGGERVAKSLNTGIVTTINYGKEVPSKVSQLTFAHEVGHNFGSPHDSGAKCAPYGTGIAGSNDGNFIMFASATMGDKPHNSEFSECSKDNITRVLHSVLVSTSKDNCFKKSGPFCGNGIVEAGEDCDCGFIDDCADPCCVPRSDSEPGCRRAPGAQCSPSEGPCCQPDTCMYNTQAGNVCRFPTGCARQATCDGMGAYCPASINEPDGSFCSKFGFTCQNGECSGSLCRAIGSGSGWDECFTTGNTDTKEEQAQLCKLACQDPVTNETSGCVVSSKETLQTDHADYYQMLEAVISGRDDGSKIQDGVKLAPGSPCNNFQGYCDVMYRCRGVDAEGPLARLKNLIFNPETLKDISNWIVEKWWAVVLMAVGLVLAMGLFIKFCAVHTPSSNPAAKPARKLSETMTLRRKRNHNRPLPAQPPQQQHYPQAKYEKPRGDRGRERDYYYDPRNEELIKDPNDPKYPIKNPQGPPPPYPGSSTSAAGSHLGPPHGHGKKGKAHKGQNIEMGRVKK